MATVAVGHPPIHHWQQSFASQHTQPSFQYGPPSVTPQPYGAAEPPIRPRNDVDLTRDRLILILDYFSQLLTTPFNNRPLRIAIHGGACMLLHPGLYKLSLQQHQLSPSLPHRTTTRDVDYIHRSFVTEMTQLAIPNAAANLKECILATARHFNLGADWMNSDADIALPMAKDPTGTSYDPIYAASVQPNNIDLHTIYRSPNSMLTLISVTPFWAVSLKLVRYTLHDAADICLLLRNGTILSGTKWTHEMLREWLFANCWTMGYAGYDAKKTTELNIRLMHAIQMVSEWGTASNSSPKHLAVSAHAAMGGGEVVGGEHGRQGWQSSFGTWPNSQQAIAPATRSQTQAVNQPPSLLAQLNEPDWDTPAGSQAVKRSETIEEVFIPPDAHQFSYDYDYNQPPAAHRRPRNSRQRDSTPPVNDPYHVADSRTRPSTPWHTQTDFSSMQDLGASLGPLVQYPQKHFVPAPSEAPVIPIVSRKKEKKKRDKAREKDRRNKWFPRNSDETDSSDDEYNAAVHRRTSSWQIYAPPNPNVPHAGQISRSHSYPQPQIYAPPSMPTPPQDRHRPPPLDLSPTPRPVGLPPTHFIPAHTKIPIPAQGQPPQPHPLYHQQQQQANAPIMIYQQPHVPPPERYHQPQYALHPPQQQHPQQQQQHPQQQQQQLQQQHFNGNTLGLY